MADSATFKDTIRRLPFWDRLGYRSKPAEAVLYLCALSGLPLWSVLGVPWTAGRWLLLAHVAVSLLAFPLFVLPFWLSHRRHLSGSTRPFLRQTGRIIELALATSLASGLWLVLFGDRGALPGAAAFLCHLIVAAPLTVLVIVHSWRYGVLRLPTAAMAAAALLLLSMPAQGAQSSASFLLADGGATLYSANFQAGSVSRLNRADGVRTAVRVLGGDIERIALAPETSTLAATDPVGGKIHLLRAKSLEPYKTLTVGGRPFGIVYDPHTRLFRVALFESGRLLAVAADGTIKSDVAVAPSPRGLALLSDGRLLVSHALTGAVSVLDARQPQPKPLRTIELAHEEDPVETVSQGYPRLLDHIAVSPDETEAWLPHVLWNFDHPFQFQSTIFPAISVLSLEAGNEREAPEHRKQLFKQINILEDGNRTRIVANPDSAAFSEDGSRVYVTAAGSEDLLVFDRSRGGGLKHGERRARRVGKIEQGGAKAVQVFRRLPGDNPRGVVVSGRDIFVQNAMSLDVSRLDAGEDDAFATVTLASERHARLVDQDPLPPPLRRGLRLFHSANTDDIPAAPMAGDSWMSCQSCHLDGFNFTNGALFRDSALDKSSRAVPGHAGLKTMVAGDFVGDYLRMIRDTQGGMGADTRFATPSTDPAAPDAMARGMMEDLHAYVTAPENLPFLSTWLRLDDPRGTSHPKEWLNSASCKSCHSAMFDQWADSLHRMMANSNPYYRVVEDLAAKTEGEDFRRWCLGCHQPQGVLSGLTRTEGPLTLFEKGGASLLAAHAKGQPVQEEGTGCLMCHRITRTEAVSAAGGGNASLTVNLKDRESYVFETAQSGIAGWLGRTQVNAKPAPHVKSYSQPFYKEPELCATCHGEFAPGSGAVIVDTYGEWKGSPFNRPDDPSQHRTCIDCHMHGDIARIGQQVPGISTDGGRVKDNVVTHQFTGANYHLVGLRNDRLAAMSVELLRSAARLSLPAQGPGALVVRVANVGAGHALPTGVADFREMWLDVTVTDATGRQVLRSGALAADGSLPENGTRLFRKLFGDRDGKPVGLLFWRYEKLLDSTMIPAGGHRDERFELPADTVYPLNTDVRLMFRTYPQWVTDAVRQAYPEMPPPQPVEMARLTQTVEHP